MPVFERIYLHIGLHKTGTSTVQRFFFDNRELLATEFSLYYPRLDANLSQTLYSAFTEDPVAYPQNIQSGLDTEASVSEFNAANLDALAQEFQSAGARHLLLSGETISHLSEAGVQRLSDWLATYSNDIRVLCLVRDPVRWSVSEAQSEIRGGETLDAINARPQHQRIRRKLERFLAVFGRDAIDVLSFESAIDHRNGLIGSVLAYLGYTPGWAEGRTPPPQNESMSLEAARLVSSINQQLPLIKEGRLGSGRSRGDVRRLARETAGQRFSLETPALERIAAEAEDDLAWLRREFGLELDGGWKERGEEPEDTIPFTPEAVDTIALQLLAREEERKGLFAAKRELDSVKQQLARLDGENSAVRAELTAMRSSMSWRLTMPLRWLKRRLASGD